MKFKEYLSPEAWRRISQSRLSYFHTNSDLSQNVMNFTQNNDWSHTKSWLRNSHTKMKISHFLTESKFITSTLKNRKTDPRLGRLSRIQSAFCSGAKIDPGGTHGRLRTSNFFGPTSGESMPKTFSVEVINP